MASCPTAAPLSTSIVEGINNTIKVIKRRAYGYRDTEYFFLKIRATLPRKSAMNRFYTLNV